MRSIGGKDPSNTLIQMRRGGGEATRFHLWEILTQIRLTFDCEPQVATISRLYCIRHRMEVRSSHTGQTTSPSRAIFAQT
jgi:hypothetical protein